MLERLEGEQNAVDSWLKGLHRFMDEHRDVPVGELQLLEELLDRSNVSAGCLGFYCDVLSVSISIRFVCRSSLKKNLNIRPEWRPSKK